jgi:hypothetical protein
MLGCRYTDYYLGTIKVDAQSSPKERLSRVLASEVTNPSNFSLKRMPSCLPRLRRPSVARDHVRFRWTEEETEPIRLFLSTMAAFTCEPSISALLFQSK